MWAIPCQVSMLYQLIESEEIAIKQITINNKVFKHYKGYYYISEDGEVYSLYSNKLLKPSIDVDGYPRVDIYIDTKQIHKKIHLLVYETWVGKIEENLQINHKDDNKLNNHYTNLYLGTQKQNIQDCINNGSRVGNTQTLIVRDMSTNQILYFSPMKNFFDYAGHKQSNGSVRRVLNRKWFKEKFEFIRIEKGVTTIENIAYK